MLLPSFLIMENKQLITLASKLVGLIAVASVGSLAAAFNADAASLLFSDSDSFTNELTELEGMPSLTVDKFTPPPGVTITEVQVTLMATLDSEGILINNAAQPKSFAITTLVSKFDVVPGEDAPPVLSTLQPFAPFELIGSQNYIDIPPIEPQPFGPFNISGMDSASFTTDADIAGFLGGGTFSMEPFTLIFTTFAGGGGSSAPNITTFASATLTVKYFGEPIPTSTPEPSALLGLGLMAGLGFVSQKRCFK